MADDAFVGAWLVRETVFSPAGERLGEVAQRRVIEDVGEGRLRVMQHCEPDHALASAAHPMAGFAGDHVFTLRRRGALRTYLGPAVIGGALVIGEGAMIGRGAWPHFGYSFTSWSVVVAPDRQLTGGRFHRGGATMGVIVGVGAPEPARVLAKAGVPYDTSESRWPSLGVGRSPGDVASSWSGVRCEVDNAGNTLGEDAVSRRYTGPLSWKEGDAAITLASRDDAFAVEGSRDNASVRGFARRFGWMIESEVVVGDDVILESVEILDEERRHLVVIERLFVDQSLQRAAVLRLRPEAEA